ncbi:hypothetical protein Y900_017250 [Mycolicibacterium aromaticivorans JS19b1 = JCM 16368]|uniref:Right handed beta helix domain-containing protein n=1 Tax=Mycolicibacterium aromaticivorans JS19b1 = JCM 16368 TaxID=1440774 RepID=A0A064CLT6_9MYCO|nr:hypothetical protein Y900_017250 [Mycolicibacterium aromaticivorans JS19b1 = JCM 16368]
MLGLAILAQPTGLAAADDGSDSGAASPRDNASHQPTISPSGGARNRHRPTPAASAAGKTVHQSAVAHSHRLGGKDSARPAATKRGSATSAGVSADAAGAATCTACLGLTAPSIEQGLVTATNHLFNSAFDLLATYPAGPISNVVEGGLLLIRRTLFGFVPTGVSASVSGDSLIVAVHTGSVAYFRDTGTAIEVAGDPAFSSAQEFTATSVDHVMADAAGNGGCAGFVFTGGTAIADFTTTGIDSLRFESDAAFKGAVTANWVPGSLTLSQAVRGLAGVTINAPVVLLSDTEIDAGTGNATFAGTVDGRGWFGGQSLLVTALGTTTFAGSVGSRSPLGSLTTRGIAPLNVRQSPDSVTVPLHYLPIAGDVKYGIDVAIGDNPSRVYLFDTGGNGFFAGYDPAAFSGVPLGDETAQITYTSGQTLYGRVTPANITIGSGKQAVSTDGPVDLAAVVSATNGSGQPISPNAPFGTQFAGDFGGAFGVQQIDGQLLYAPGSFVTSVLFQLPGNLSSGYLTQLGPIGSTPQLTVGVTDELRAQFPYAIPIAAVPAPSDPQDPAPAGYYPVSGYPLLEQFGFSPTYTVTPADYPSQPAVILGGGPLPSLIDSGAGSTSARLPDPLAKPYMDSSGQLIPGTVFTGELPTVPGYPSLTWSFTAGTIGSVDQVGYLNTTGAATDVPNVNTGLNLFNDFDVMYDVAEQRIWLRPNGGQSTVSLQSVTTRGAQSYGQNAQLNGVYRTGGGDFSVAGITQLNGGSVIDTGRGNVTFSGTVDATTAGAQGLQVNSRGATNFVRQVGGVKALASLTTDRPGSTATAGVTTTGAQTYFDRLTLNGAYVTTAGAFYSASSTTLAGPSSVSTNGSAITFGGRVDSAAGAGNVLGLSAPNSTVNLNAAVGSKNALGGLNLKSGTVTARGSISLNGGLPNSQGAGLFIGDNVTAKLAHGGTIADFTVNGVQFDGASTSSVLRGFTIADNVYDGIQLGGGNYTGTSISYNTLTGNSGFGIETLRSTTGLAIRHNTIGAKGTANEFGYVSAGPNAQGIVLAPGDYTATVIADNTIQYNRRAGIAAPDGVQGLEISGNTVSRNQGNGIDFTGGDFTGTVVTGNTITGNVGDGISLGAGIDQALNDFGNPADGYRDNTGSSDPNPYAYGHYVLHWSNDPGFYTQPVPADPQVLVSFDGGPAININLDTGSRGLYIDQGQVPNLDTSGGTPGCVYLNSSNRMFFGTWVNTSVTFPDSTWVGPSAPANPAVATADVPVLVVSAVGASTTPAPGTSTATAVFNTLTDQGTVTITDGTTTRQVQITPGVGGVGTVTIPGGWWASYDANPGILGPVMNFGVGFDRTGFGTEPTQNGNNQDYNAFLNLTQMRAGTMRPGYVITAGGVILGLDSSTADSAVTGVGPYAYTDLAPSGLSRGSQTVPDWQPATGQVTYKPDPADPGTYQQGNLGSLVIDIGIPTGILTLPGQSGSSTFTGALDVDLLNSGGKIHYTVDPTDSTNQMTATAVDFFDPLAGAFSQNMPPQSGQFFNTGRRVIAGMNYLYDAAGGYLGLYTPADPSGGNELQYNAFHSANGSFEAGYYPNSTIPDGVTDIAIGNNTISGNGGNGVTVNGHTSSGNALTGNRIFDNAGLGIALTNGGNGGQPTPVVSSAVRDRAVLTVTGSVAGIDGYSGPFTIQVFSNPASGGGNVQGRKLIGTIDAATNDFVAQFPWTVTTPGSLITVVATPATGTPNTSQYSAGVPVQ